MQVGPEVLEADDHTMAPLFLAELAVEVDDLRAQATKYPRAVADMLDRALEVGAKIGHWQRVEGTGPDVLARFRGARRREAESLEAEVQFHRENGVKGGTTKATNAKRKRAAEATAKAEGNAPRMKVLEVFRKEHPDCTLPEAAAALLEANTIPSQDAGEKWLRRMVKDGGIATPFKPGKRGRPLAG